MLPEISLHVLDIVHNSIKAAATLIEISISIDSLSQKMDIVIKDNGCGMTQEQAINACDPFFTTRTTRKVGLGLSLYKMASEATGGTFFIHSEPGIGTVVTTCFHLNHIDCMPLGNITETMHSLITCYTDIDFLYTYSCDSASFTLDTREFREILDHIPFYTPEVSEYIHSYLSENKYSVDRGLIN